jgi:hypothetical protein
MTSGWDHDYFFIASSVRNFLFNDVFYRGHKMITLQSVAVIVAEQRRDQAYQIVLQAQRELLRYEYEYVASLKALEQSTINEGT